MAARLSPRPLSSVFRFETALHPRLERMVARMKRSFWLFVSLVLPLIPASAVAQDHGEVGVFADYFRTQFLPQDEVGVGARVSVNFMRHIALEAEGAYDFERTRVNILTPDPGISNTSRSSLRLTHFLVGPKLQAGSRGPFRAFLFAKGGFLRFGTNTGPATFGNAGIATNLGRSGGDYNGVFYPGGGVEAFIGPVGLRLDVGDEIYFDNGANNNLKVTFGPHIRF